MIVLPKEQIERCSKCKKYLSVGPIQLLENKPICGRCPDVLGFSAQLYENLVKYMFFPCVNDLHGCDATLAWGSVETHENKCLFSTIECPAITCGETIRPNQLKYHFQLKHENLFLHNSQFEIPLRHIYLDEYVNKLTFWRSKPLIVKISFSSRRCFCSILNWSPDGSDELKYSLTVEDIGDLQFGVQSLHIKDIPLPTYKNKYHDITTMTQIDLETMKRILHTDYVTCSFGIGRTAEEDNSLNEHLLSELECPVCTNYMKPPIFMCPAGHSLCSKCKPHISLCPICQMDLEHRRNISLEKLTIHINFPCTFNDNGCEFIGDVEEVALHEVICPIAKNMEMECYTYYSTSCSWRGSHSNVLSHISSMHPNLFVDVNHPITLDLSKFLLMNVFLGKQGQVFKLNIHYIKLDNIKFIVKTVKGTTKIKEKYQYFLDFVDLDDTKKVLYISKNCVISLPDNDRLLKCLNVPYHLVKPFVKNNIIEFKIHIVEK